MLYINTNIKWLESLDIKRYNKKIKNKRSIYISIYLSLEDASETVCKLDHVLHSVE